MEALLNNAVAFDVNLLDTIVKIFSDATHPQPSKLLDGESVTSFVQRGEANSVLMRFREDPESWIKADTILAHSTNNYSKYLALQLLEDVIKYRWKTFPAVQREGIRAYLVQKSITLSSDETIMDSDKERLLIGKLNLLIVQILKQDWPEKWPSFIPDLVASSKTSEVLCENNVDILRLLSEEVFDFSKGSLTTARAAHLKQSLKNEFSQIFELLIFVLQASTRPALIAASLRCLQRYVTWIPEPYIFETPLLEILCEKFLPAAEYRVHALEVLTEVSGLAKPEYNNIFELLFMGVMSHIVRIIPADVNIRTAYQTADQNMDNDSLLFIRHLALFLTTYFREHVQLLENETYKDALLSGMNYLVGISDVEDTEIFKICVEYWLRLSSDLYGVEVTYDPRLPAISTDGESPVQFTAPTYSAVALLQDAPIDPSTGRPTNPRKLLYSEILSRVRELMIRHFAKPEEVLIEKDESGEYVKEQQKDTDTIALYKVMRDTMVFLTHLDPKNTEELMLEKLTHQVDGSEWGFEPLNTLCWAIGSVSGTMSEVAEKHFLVTVIKDLLVLCETKKGKSNKAVVASNIMYVVGQYPRFLRAHWKFLRTVVMKLFEFMHEKHPGVQDMAVDTFLKIAEKCKKKFVQVQVGETVAFIDELCSTLPSIINDLEPHQIYTFYEAAGHMVSAHAEEAYREDLTERLLALPYNVWTRLMRQAADNIDCLRNTDNLKELQRVLRAHTAACRSIGPSFSSQLAKLYLDMLNVYRAVSSFITSGVAASGPSVMQHWEAKLMSTIKKDTLKLIGTFVKKSDNPRFVAEHFIPPLLDSVLPDYENAHPAAREPEVLVLMTDVVSQLQADIAAEAPRVLAATFEPTLQMITGEGSEFPEHRISFFKLLEAINTHCYQSVAALSADQQKLILESVYWAIRNVSREISETGLNILKSLIEATAAAPDELSQPFYLEHLLRIFQELLTVLTDRLHKGQLSLHAELLRRIAYLVDMGMVTAPLWESPTAAETGLAGTFESICTQLATANGRTPADYANNPTFVREFLRAQVSNAFQNLTAGQVQTLLDNMFSVQLDQKFYKTHLRDFLIEVLEFKEKDAEGDLFADERAVMAQQVTDVDLETRKAVPGLANPYDVLPADYEAIDYNLDDL